MYPHHHHAEQAHKGRRRSAFTDFMRRNKYYVGFATLMLLVILSVIIGVSMNKEDSSSAAGSAGVTTDTTVDQSLDPLTRKKADLMGRIKSSFSVLGLPESHSGMLDGAESAQARALNWVAASDKYDEYDENQRLQRYALASFFYATYAVRNAYVTQQVPWTSAEKWLSDEHECDWEGITCEGPEGGKRVVTKLELEEHRISGTIPLDLVLLRESLHSLILTNNLIFMEGDSLSVFGYMEALEVIMLADNYVVERTGMPDAFRNLSKLRKLIMSYNLLQGAIHPQFFSNLGKLSHLEIESNYLSGPLPSSIYEMEQLVYLYVRRNDFNFNIDHAMKTANWPNMCKYLQGKSTDRFTFCKCMVLDLILLFVLYFPYHSLHVA